MSQRRIFVLAQLCEQHGRGAGRCDQPPGIACSQPDYPGFHIQRQYSRYVLSSSSRICCKTCGSADMSLLQQGCPGSTRKLIDYMNAQAARAAHYIHEAWAASPWTALPSETGAPPRAWRQPVRVNSSAVSCQTAFTIRGPALHSLSDILTCRRRHLRCFPHRWWRRHLPGADPQCHLYKQQARPAPSCTPLNMPPAVAQSWQTRLEHVAAWAAPAQGRQLWPLAS